MTNRDTQPAKWPPKNHLTKGNFVFQEERLGEGLELGSGHSLNSIGVGRQLREQRKVQVPAWFPSQGGGEKESLEEMGGKTLVTSLIAADSQSSLQKMPMVFTGPQCVLGSWLI